MQVSQRSAKVIVLALTILAADSALIITLIRVQERADIAAYRMQEVTMLRTYVRQQEDAAATTAIASAKAVERLEELRREADKCEETLATAQWRAD